MKHILPLILLLSVSPIMRAQEVTPDQVCIATTEFLNEVANSNFETQRGNLLGSDTNDYEKLWWYESLKTFPLAKSVRVVDEDIFDDFSRRVEIEMHSEFEDEPTPAMLDYYKQICDVFKACLEPNGFTLPVKRPNMWGNSIMADLDSAFASNLHYTVYTLDLRKLYPEIGENEPDLLKAQVEIEDEDTDFGTMQVLYIRFLKEAE